MYFIFLCTTSRECTVHILATASHWSSFLSFFFPFSCVCMFNVCSLLSCLLSLFKFVHWLLVGIIIMGLLHSLFCDVSAPTLCCACAAPWIHGMAIRVVMPSGALAIWTVWARKGLQWHCEHLHYWLLVIMVTSEGLFYNLKFCVGGTFFQNFVLVKGWWKVPHIVFVCLFMCLWVNWWYYVSHRFMMYPCLIYPVNFNCNKNALPFFLFFCYILNQNKHKGCNRTNFNSNNLFEKKKTCL